MKYTAVKLPSRTMHVPSKLMMMPGVVWMSKRGSMPIRALLEVAPDAMDRALGK
jgi:hypothetical protein